MDVGPETTECPHVRDMIRDTSKRERFIRQFKVMTMWSMRRKSIFNNLSKRRKVVLTNIQDCLLMLPRSLHQPVENATLHYLDRLHAWNVRLPGAGLAGISFITLSAKIINSVCIETSSRNVYADWIRSWRWIWLLVLCRVQQLYLQRNYWTGLYELYPLYRGKNHPISRYVSCIETSVTSKIFPVSQMLRQPYSPWVPNEQETATLEGTVAIPCQGKIKNSGISF